MVPPESHRCPCSVECLTSNSTMEQKPRQGSHLISSKHVTVARKQAAWYSVQLESFTIPSGPPTWLDISLLVLRIVFILLKVLGRRVVRSLRRQDPHEKVPSNTHCCSDLPTGGASRGSSYQKMSWLSDVAPARIYPSIYQIKLPIALAPDWHNCNPSIA